MAGIGEESVAGALSRQQFKTIAWLRWRIFVNALRRKGATGELIARILSYPVVAAMVLGPAIAAGVGSYYFASRGMDAYLAIPLWIIFALWQFVGASTSTTAPPFDLSTLTRFPIRYRDYLLISLSFGLLDIPTLSGSACLLAVGVGFGIAAPHALLWALLSLALFAVCNILFSRMVYSWLERWLAQRRTRELFTVIFLVVSLGFQFTGQLIQRFSGLGHHGPVSAFVVTAGRVLVTINWMLPAGLTARSIQWMHAGTPWVAIAAFAGLMAYTVGFLSILNLRLHAQYLGENLSEAPATTQQKSKKTPVSSAALAPQAAHRKIVASPRGSILSASVEACLVKEIRYLLRSGPKLYSLIMPVFMIFLFSLRSAGLHGSGLAQRGFGQDAIHSYLFSYGCAYTQLVLVALLYNSLGGDGMGAQFYFLAPVRFRDVMVAKNLMTGGILAIETILIYLVSALLTAPSPAGMTAATLAWTAFTFLLNMSIGNVRSLVAPKGFEVGKVRRQNVSGLNSFISLGVVLVSIALGVITVFVCRSLQQGYWLAAGVFLIFACMAFGLYWMTLQSLDRIAGDHRESLAQELCKS